MKRLGQIVLSLAVTLLFSWWAFRDTNWHAQWESLKGARLSWIALYFGICCTIHFIRTLRWGALLSGLEKVPFRPLNEACAIGFMMLIVLPFRLGEFARPFLIAQRSKIKKSPAMTSVVLERIADGLSIAVLLRVLMLFMHGDSKTLALVKLGANLTFLVFGGGFVFLLFARRHQERAVRLVRTLAGWVSPKLADKIASVVDSFVGALRQLPSRGQLLVFFLLTATYWGLNGLSMSVLARAFACDLSQLACMPLNVTVFQGYVVLCVLVVGVMIPSAPGMVGTFQAAVKLGLSLFLPAAIVNGTGLAFANVMWLCQTTQQVAFGLIFMSASGGSFSDIAGKLGADAEPA